MGNGSVTIPNEMKCDASFRVIPDLNQSKHSCGSKPNWNDLCAVVPSIHRTCREMQHTVSGSIASTSDCTTTTVAIQARYPDQDLSTRPLVPGNRDWVFFSLGRNNGTLDAVGVLDSIDHVFSRATMYCRQVIMRFQGKQTANKQVCIIVRSRLMSTLYCGIEGKNPEQFCVYSKFVHRMTQ